MHLRFSVINLLAATAASVSAVATGPAPEHPTVTAALNPGPAPPHLNARQDPSSPIPSPPFSAPLRPSPSAPSPSQPSPSPPFPTAPTPLPTSCASSLTAILAALPTPPTTAGPDFSRWAVASAPIQLVAAAISNNNNYASFGGTDTDVDALCARAATAATAPPALATAYASYLNEVQSWRYDVEGDAYRLAGACGYEVGLGLELLMATEAAMCTSGLSASVVPWKTAGAGAVSWNAAVPRPTGVPRAVVVLVVARIAIIGKEGMGSFVRPGGFEPPFKSGSEPAFQGPFTTLLSASSRVSASPSALSPDSSPPGTTSDDFIGGPSPGQASSSQPFFRDNQPESQMVISLLIVAAITLVAAPFITIYCHRRRRRQREQLEDELETGQHRSMQDNIISPGDLNGDRGDRGDHGGIRYFETSRRGSWEAAIADADAALQEYREERCRGLREEGLNELGEPPPPYKRESDLPCPIPYESPAAGRPESNRNSNEPGPEEDRHPPPTSPSSPPKDDIELQPLPSHDHPGSQTTPTVAQEPLPGTTTTIPPPALHPPPTAFFHPPRQSAPTSTSRSGTSPLPRRQVLPRQNGSERERERERVRNKNRNRNRSISRGRSRSRTEWV
ncbi:hypothetical protein C8A00DRAFT_33635 [Chaetomidium leptoderma]|uniref:Uncharacterized protein n=1 Tax=Chaetomidium leptoderma TaxID=669021 RepID=A0AAN6VNM0_9PEZI|nr:hypothetical protein C8A00DRAFT_33635 [Chaetomidium leptoderma]